MILLTDVYLREFANDLLTYALKSSTESRIAFQIHLITEHDIIDFSFPLEFQKNRMLFQDEMKKLADTYTCLAVGYVYSDGPILSSFVGTKDVYLKHSSIGAEETMLVSEDPYRIFPLLVPQKIAELS